MPCNFLLLLYWIIRIVVTSPLKRSVSLSVLSDSLRSMDYTLPGSSGILLWDSPGNNTGVNSHSFLQEFSRLRDQTWVSRIAADSLLYEPPGEPKEAFRIIFILIWLGLGLCLMFAVALGGPPLWLN